MFFFPATHWIEKDGSFVSSGRRAQWKWKVLDAPGEVKDDNRILGIRAEACQQRFSSDESWWSPDPIAMLWSRVPIYILTAEDMFHYNSGVAILDSNETMNTFVDIQRYNRDLRLAKFYSANEAYSCPLTKTHICSAARPECLTGLTTTAQFPAAPQCSVRDGLEKAGFAL